MIMASEEEVTLKTIHLTYDEDEEAEEDNAEVRRMSRLSMESSDGGEEADAELTSDEDAGVGGRRRRRTRRRERWLSRAWQMRKDRCGGDDVSAGRGAVGDHGDLCRVLVRPRGPRSGSIRMDLDEVKACRELGIELPCDWTVEIPGGFSELDTSSGASSPIGSWRISNPGDDPRDVKARLKVWAQAVALASASSLSG